MATLFERVLGYFRRRVLGLPANRFHPMVWINGEPKIGRDVYIGGFSVVNGKDTVVEIGDECDIASFVSINSADSHARCLGLSNEIDRKPIRLGRRVFVGSHTVIKGGATIGEYSVIAAGTVVEGVDIPPYSLVYGNPMQVRAGYYRDRVKDTEL